MATEPASADSLAAQHLAELRLLQLTDSSLPIGALAHSFGLETLVASKLLDAPDIPVFLHGYLGEAGLVDAVFCRAAFCLAQPGAFSITQWRDLNDLLSARKAARESRAASAVLGQNFLRAVAVLIDSGLLRAALQITRPSATARAAAVHHVTSFGLAAGVLGVPEDRAVLAYLHQSVAALVSALQRLLPLGQTAATRILWNLKPSMLDAARRSTDCSLSDACSFMPLFDWAAMEHPALSTRLFIS
jgi:urease accessory protein